MTLTLTTPAGRPMTITAGQLRNVTATSFAADLTLAVPGNWTLELTNSDGQRSARFTLPVA